MHFLDPNDLENGQPISITENSPLMSFKKETFTTYVNNLKTQTNVINTSSKKTPLKSVNKLSFETKKTSSDMSPKLSLTINNNSPTKSENSEVDNSFLFDLNYIEKIINDHALNLLNKYKLKKLGYMFANLTDFSILKWLKNEP